MILYTVITNQYDTLREPRVVTPGWRYICFSDKPIESKVWEYWEIENIDRIDRRVKIKAHEYFDSGIIVYIDGNFKIVGDLNDFISNISSPFSFYRHNQRNCSYKEAEVLLERDMLDSVLWNRQKKRYQSEGFPIEWGLGENSILVRDLSNDKVRGVNESWWNEWENGGKRDQLSLMYCLWKAGWSPTYLRKPRSRYFKKRKHVD